MMTDALKIVSLVNDQNTPTKVTENLFSGEFEATYDIVNISYNDSEGYERQLTFNNVVIKSELETSLLISSGTFETKINITMWSDNNRVIDHRLHRPKLVQQFVFIAQAIRKNFEDANKAKNNKLWDIVDKF